MKKIAKKLTLRMATIRKLDGVTGAMWGNTGNTVGIPQSDPMICRTGGTDCPRPGTDGPPCWDSFQCFTVDC
ncbi:MAG TPA: hypothetical protein VL463_12610 [Kofleriaceae bacterium]|nr:hypothetical protein [Kofleriaceae bacterium]